MRGLTAPLSVRSSTTPGSRKAAAMTESAAASASPTRKIVRPLLRFGDVGGSG